MTDAQIADVIEAYATAAASAEALGFDGVEVHGAHGYLIDQFLWGATNRRADKYGGDAVQRTRFAADVIRACRARIGEDFPLFIRISQWKLHDFEARLATTPGELEVILTPLVDAGIDVFHCSQRRYFDPEFPGSELNLAGWVRKLSGKPTITVGSVGLDADMKVDGVDRVTAMFDRGDFDLIAVGRAILGDHQWPEKMRTGRRDEIAAFDRGALDTLF